MHSCPDASFAFSVNKSIYVKKLEEFVLHAYIKFFSGWLCIFWMNLTRISLYSFNTITIMSLNKCNSWPNITMFLIQKIFDKKKIVLPEESLSYTNKNRRMRNHHSLNAIYIWSLSLSLATNKTIRGSLLSIDVSLSLSLFCSTEKKPFTFECQ